MNRKLLAISIFTAGAALAGPFQYSFTAPIIDTGSVQTTNAFSFAFTAPALLTGAGPFDITSPSYG